MSGSVYIFVFIMVLDIWFCVGIFCLFLFIFYMRRENWKYLSNWGDFDIIKLCFSIF